MNKSIGIDNILTVKTSFTLLLSFAMWCKRTEHASVKSDAIKYRPGSEVTLTLQRLEFFFI